MVFDSIASRIITKVIEFGPIVLSLLTAVILIFTLASNKDLTKQTKGLIITSIVLSLIVAITAFSRLFMLTIA